MLVVKTTYGKSSALILIVGSHLTLGPSFKVECGPIIPIMAYISLAITHGGFGCENNL